jgi:hypothetical protein
VPLAQPGRAGEQLVAGAIAASATRLTVLAARAGGVPGSRSQPGRRSHATNSPAPPPTAPATQMDAMR